MENFVDPGPLDPSVLTLQASHRSEYIWARREVEPLRLRRGPDIQVDLDIRIQAKLVEVGFFGAYKLGHYKYDWSLIEALIERWRPETHSFHLPVGEMTITLQDVGMLSGLPIDGSAVISSETSKKKEAWAQLCQELLGITPLPTDMNGGTVTIKWILSKMSFEDLGTNPTQFTVEAHTRAYVFILLGAYLMPDSSGGSVKLLYLPLLRDLDAIQSYSWGGALLAFLYRELCVASRPNAKTCAGCLTILQLWAWERLLFTQPMRTRGDTILLQNALFPYGCRWKGPLSYKHVTDHNLNGYRDQLAFLTEDQVEWQPYKDVAGPPSCFQGQAIWTAKVPLICFERVEWHLPDRVMRQFGMLQRIPNTCDTSTYLHGIDRRGRSDADWVVFHGAYIELWKDRANHVVEGDYGVEDVGYTHPYMLWYRTITRSLIQHPCDVETVGYRSHSSCFEGLIQNFQRMYVANENAMLMEGQYGISLPNLHLNRHLIRQSLEAIRETQRLDINEAPPEPVDRAQGVPQRQNQVRRHARHVQEDPEESENEDEDDELQGNPQPTSFTQMMSQFDPTIPPQSGVTQRDYTLSPPAGYGFSQFSSSSGSGSRTRIPSVSYGEVPQFGSTRIPSVSYGEVPQFGSSSTQAQSTSRSSPLSLLRRAWSGGLPRRNKRDRNPPATYTPN